MPSAALSGNVSVVFLGMCHHAASVLVLSDLRGASVKRSCRWFCHMRPPAFLT
jgi:hypothetical protein